MSIMGDEENPSSEADPPPNDTNNNEAVVEQPEKNNGDDDDDDPLPPSSSNTPTSAPTTTAIPTPKRSINSYYGHKIGFLQTLSLTLNAGFMIYAHLGLSAVIFSSRDPSMTGTTASNTGNTNNDAQVGVGGGDGNNTADGKCNAQDYQIWITEGAEDKLPERSYYCSLEWNGGCFLDGDCVERCFQENYGYSQECSSCFGVIPTCSSANDCLLVW